MIALVDLVTDAFSSQLTQRALLGGLLIFASATYIAIREGQVAKQRQQQERQQ